MRFSIVAIFHLLAALTPQSLNRDGLEATYAAAAAGGDTFANDGRTFLHVKNGGGASVNVTVDSIKQCDQGVDHDVIVAVPAGEERMIGPFPVSRFGSPATIAYSGVTTVTVAALKLAQ